MPGDVSCPRCSWLRGKPGGERVWPHCARCGSHHAKDVPCAIHAVHTKSSPRALTKSA